MLTGTQERRTGHTMTDAARAKHNAYQREYRRLHPEKTRQWRDAYIMRRAARLAAAQALGGGDDHNART